MKYIMLFLISILGAQITLAEVTSAKNCVADPEKELAIPLCEGDFLLIGGYVATTFGVDGSRVIQIEKITAPDTVEYKVITPNEVPADRMQGKFSLSNPNERFASIAQSVPSITQLVKYTTDPDLLLRFRSLETPLTVETKVAGIYFDPAYPKVKMSVTLLFDNGSALVEVLESDKADEVGALFFVSESNLLVPTLNNKYACSKEEIEQQIATMDDTTTATELKIAAIEALQICSFGKDK